MASTPFVAVSWEPKDVVTKDKVDQQNTNAHYLLEHTPRARLIRDDRKNIDMDTLVLGGRIKIPKNPKGQTSSAKVTFPRGKDIGFSPNTKPNVTIAVVSQPQRKVFCVINGIDGTNMPDHRGFEVKVYVKDATMRTVSGSKSKIAVIDKEFWVSYIAVGLSRDTL